MFGNTFMHALFGDLAGVGSAIALENNFSITPFIGKLLVFIDEVQISSAAAINEVKKLVRETRISGEVKFRDRKGYQIYSRLILTANQADIGLNPEDAADRTLFFITSWNAENKHMNTQEFLQWTYTLKPFFTDFTDMLERVDVRQHLLRHFMDIEVTRAELEDLKHSSFTRRCGRRQGDDVEDPRGRAGDRRLGPHHCGQRPHGVVQHPPFARRDLPGGAGSGARRAASGDAGIRACQCDRADERRASTASIGATERRCRNSAMPTIWKCFHNNQPDQLMLMSTLSCQPSTRRRGVETRSRMAMG